MSKHLATPELLLDYASGAMTTAPALAIASHIALNPRAAADYGLLNAVGGALLDELDGGGVGEEAVAAMMARLDAPAQPAAAQAGRGAAGDALPYPLRQLVGPSLDALRWRPLGRGIVDCRLPVADARHKAVLLKLAPGRAVPRHRHRGLELTVVLRGRYRDGAQCFARGDLQIADESVDHAPVAEAPDGCVCLIVLDAPLRLTGPVGRWLNGLVRY